MTNNIRSKKTASRKFFVINALAIIAFGSGLFGLVNSSVAQEFRINSSLYSGEESLAVSQNVTLFSGGLVYDFQMSSDAQPRPLEIVIFDSRNKSLILLDTEKKIRMELLDLRVTKILEGVRRETIQDSRSSFLVEEVFDEDTDWSTNWVTLTSPSITYRVNGERPKNPAIIPLYMNFLNHFTRLKATNPNQIPPFPRMKLNQVIQLKGWIPTEVQMSVKQNSLFRKPFSAKSKHVLIEGLSSKDKELIATAKSHWLQFKSVEFNEYRGLPEPKLRIPKVRTASFEEEAEIGNK